MLMAMPESWVRHSALPPAAETRKMWPRRSNTIQLPSGDRSSDIQVPSLVSKSISRVAPLGFVVSQTAGGFSWARSSAPSAHNRTVARISFPGSDKRLNIGRLSLRPVGHFTVIHRVFLLAPVFPHKYTLRGKSAAG